MQGKRKRFDAPDDGEAGGGRHYQGEDGYKEPVDKKKKKQGKHLSNGQSEGERKSIVKKENREAGRPYTISMAVPGSVVDNAQSLELATSLAGQIARAAAIFRIDEVVIFDDGEEGSRRANVSSTRRHWREKSGETGGTFLARLLQYLETPQYLRRALIPFHQQLRFAGMLPPLDAPHHVRANEWPQYREGVVVEKYPEGQGGPSAKSQGSFVNVGLHKEVRIAQKVPAGVRVTVAMGHDIRSAFSSELQAVSPSEPREKAGLYWGYSVRLVPSLSHVFSDCPYPEGYDYKIGTSEHGKCISSSSYSIPSFRHLLVTFGGLSGIEESVQFDDSIKVKEAPGLFDDYINTCPAQGSRTIRMEEAILISLAYLQEPLRRATGESL